MALILSDGIGTSVLPIKLSEATGGGGLRNTAQHPRVFQILFFAEPLAESKSFTSTAGRPSRSADTEVGSATGRPSALVSRRAAPSARDRWMCGGGGGAQEEKKNPLCNCGVREGLNVPAVPPHGNK